MVWGKYLQYKMSGGKTFLMHVSEVCVCGAGCLQALLLQGALPDDEQEVSLGLGEGVENAEQQLV